MKNVKTYESWISNTKEEKSFKILFKEIKNSFDIDNLSHLYEHNVGNNDNTYTYNFNNKNLEVVHRDISGMDDSQTITIVSFNGEMLELNYFLKKSIYKFLKKKWDEKIKEDERQEDERRATQMLNSI